MAGNNIAEVKLDQRVSDRHLEEIARSHCRHWRNLRAELGLEGIVEHDIDRDHPGDEEGKRHAFFNKWKHVKGTAATYRSLIAALKKLKYGEDAENVLRLLQQVSLRKGCGEESLLAQSKQLDLVTIDGQGSQQVVSGGASHQSVIETTAEIKGDTTLACDDTVSGTEDRAIKSPSLDPEVKEDLIHILKQNLKQIITQYACYTSSICDCLVEKGVTVERLRNFLLQLSLSEDDQHEGLLLSGLEMKLEEADTVYKIFNVIGRECASFLNYEIYQSILDRYCSYVECEHFKYPERLKAYIDKHNVKEFLDVNPQLAKCTEASTKLKLKIDIERTAKVAKVVDLKSSIAALLGIRPSALRLFSIEEGCVIVTFLIPAPVADRTFGADKMLSVKQREGFKELSVLWIQCDDVTITLERRFPKQEIITEFISDCLTIGADGHYYQLRDYNANDTEITGGFGTVRFAEDLTTNHLFAIKCNNRDNLLDSIMSEANILSKLGPHSNVIGIYGAVLEYEEGSSIFLPTRVCKMMMELGQHGTLAEMVINLETNEPFPLDRDQALFYFWQVLNGVEFLHRSNILHLNIKGANILVFDEGRTLKICGFGTAVNVDEVASKVGKNLGALRFSSPEICRMQMPHFFSDMWSTMCVLVEMLTGQKPWSRFSSCMNSLMFIIGGYSEEQMEGDLLPPNAEIDPDIVEMMGLVLRAECEERLSASSLLQHPLLVNAPSYEACFDEACFDEACFDEACFDEACFDEACFDEMLKCTRHFRPRIPPRMAGTRFKNSSCSYSKTAP